MNQPEFINGLAGLGSRHLGCVATIGSFDGVHRGHQAVLRQVIDKAKEQSLPSLVMVFEPQPHEYFSREAAPARLMRLREKVAALFAEGMDRVLCLKFNHALRSLSAVDFIEKVLIDGIGVKHLIIGDDFRFGCDRAGDFALLKKKGAELGFTVTDTRTELETGERISSTRIRQLLEQDDLAGAAGLLGRQFSVCGKVVYGSKLGRTIGFPTLNIGLGRYRSPIHGVYAVKVEVAGEVFSGAANIGVKPTVTRQKKPLLEVFVFDFSRDIYGQYVKVIFKKKIRNEMKFASVNELTEQIARDVSEIKHYFHSINSSI